MSVTVLGAIVAGLTVIVGVLKLVTYLVQTSRQRTYIKLKGQETELLNELRKAAAVSDGALVGQLERELVLLRQKIALYSDAKRVQAGNQ